MSRLPTFEMVGIAVIGVLFLIVILRSLRNIGETEIGLPIKRFGVSLPKEQVLAFRGEAGYQADLLKPGWRFKLWPIYSVEKHPLVQVPPGEIGIVIAQIGDKIPIGYRSGIYKPEFGQFTDANAFIDGGGQKGVQRPVLPPGATLVIHPVAFMVVTASGIYGVPVDEELKRKYASRGGLTHEDFNLSPEQCMQVRIQPQPRTSTKSIKVKDRGTGKEQFVQEEVSSVVDMIGIVTTHEGPPLHGSDIACRLGGFEDMGDPRLTDPIERIEKLLGSQNDRHQSYQDFQDFLDAGGKIGLQHDPLLRGTYNLNPYLVSVEAVPMLVVEQGEVAVIKSYVGLSEKDTSGKDFKFGAIVPPGHRGIWQVPIRTGKYPLNPYCYKPEIVPTQILTLNWAEGVSGAHQLDANLSPIEAVSREGFKFTLDLVVQIHVGNEEAPRVISMVGTMQNLVTDVLQAAVGNHFRDKLQSLPAVKFIEERKAVQEEAAAHIREKLSEYEVETPAVLIQDVILPEELVTVLKAREIANQRKATYTMEMEAEKIRIAKEAATGRADQQKELAKSEVGITINENNARARKAEADGESTYIQSIGNAAGAKIRSEGMALAEALAQQQAALGPHNTALVNIFKSISDGRIQITPQVQVGAGSVLDALLGVAAKRVVDGGSVTGLITAKDKPPEDNGDTGSAPGDRTPKA